MDRSPVFQESVVVVEVEVGVASSPDVASVEVVASFLVELCPMPGGIWWG